MKIGKILISNFRSILETEFQLQETVTALAGGNESGKSNALKSIKKFLDKSAFEEADQYQLSDLPPIIEVTFYNFTLDEKEGLGKLLNVPGVDELTIRRTGETYEIISPQPILREVASDEDTTVDADEAENEDNELEATTEEDEPEPVPSTEPEEEPLTLEEITEITLGWLPQVEYIRAVNDLIIGKNVLISELYDPKNTKGEIETVKKFLELGNITENLVRTPDTDTRTKHLNRGAAQIGKLLRASWNQEDIKLRIFADEERLVIHFRDGKNIAKKYRDDDSKWIWTLPEDRSDGFRWYVTFYTRYIAKLRKSKNIILLLDDAGGPLNIIAQQDLLRQIGKLCNDNNDLQVFYVTHSKDMLDWGEREKILLADKKQGSGTKVEKCWWQKYSLRNLPGPLKELGANWESDFLSPDNIVLEGYTDLLVLQRLQRVFDGVENFPQGLFVAHKLVVAGRASEMLPVGRLALATDKKVFLLPDSDAAGLSVKSNASTEDIPCNDLQTLTQNPSVFTIEDLIPRKEFLSALNEIGEKVHSDDWEEIKLLQNVSTTGVCESIKNRLNNNGVGNGIWGKMKLEVVNAAVDKISLSSYDDDQLLKTAVIQLFTTLEQTLG